MLSWYNTVIASAMLVGGRCMIAELSLFTTIKDFGVMCGGKLPQHRHAVNRYRLFRAKDVK